MVEHKKGLVLKNSDNSNIIKPVQEKGIMVYNIHFKF